MGGSGGPVTGPGGPAGSDLTGTTPDLTAAPAHTAAEVTAQADLAAQADVTGAVHIGPMIGGVPSGSEAAAVPLQPLQAAAPVATPQPPAGASPVFGPPASQIAMRIAPLRLDADGVHRLTVNLHPADLGPVQVVAEIRNGTVNVQLTGSTDAGTDALRNAMDDLRRELEQSGFANTTLDLRQGSGQDQPREQFAFPGRGTTGGGEPAAAEPAPLPPPPAPVADGRLDTRA